jgi:uncharacterized protein YdeI (YjbR/CyaY-like superfamily)
MGQHDERIDAYIAKSADFAKPILIHIREVVHKASPLINETVKWGMPFFDYKGPICMMAAFKQHCGFGFWKASRLNDPDKLLQGSDAEAAAGSFGRIASLNDLPSDEALIGFIHQMIAMNESGVKEPKKPSTPKAEFPMPADFDKLLKADLVTMGNYEKFSPSCKRKYLEWFADAKSDATREKRMQQALEWIGEGKTRNWKYK